MAKEDEARLERPEALIPDSAIGPGVLLIPYGWVMAVDPKLATACDKLVVDDWEQCTKGGTFHGLTDTERVAMCREVDAVDGPDATMLLLVWPRRRRPLSRGANRDEIEGAFPGWKITEMVPSFFRLPKPLEAVMKPNEHWYRLRREWQSHGPALARPTDQASPAPTCAQEGTLALPCS